MPSYEHFVLRETNIKDICLDLASEGLIQNTWGPGRRKPTDDTLLTKSAVSL